MKTEARDHVTPAGKIFRGNTSYVAAKFAEQSGIRGLFRLNTLGRGNGKSGVGGALAYGAADSCPESTSVRCETYRV